MQGIFNILLMIVLGLILTVTVVGIPIVLIYCYLVFFGTQKRITTASDKLAQTLMSDETLFCSGVQKRPFALISRREIVGITNSRVICVSRGLLGGFTMKDFQWKDLRDVQLSENVLPNTCGSNLSFSASTLDISVSGIEREAAVKMYKQAQSEEQAWEEKRRIRELEERRAAAGGVTLHAPAAHVPSTAASQSQGGTSSFNLTDELERVKKLLDSGAINDAEYQEIKSKILSKTF